MIEVLRAMRMIYFLAWCSTQAEIIVQTLSQIGEVIILAREIADLQKQLHIIEQDHLGKREVEMSIKRSVNVTCPGCGTTQTSPWWSA